MHGHRENGHQIPQIRTHAQSDNSERRCRERAYGGIAVDASNGNGDAPCPLGPVNESAPQRSRGDVSTMEVEESVRCRSKKDGGCPLSPTHWGTGTRSRNDTVVLLSSVCLFIYLFQ